METTPLPTVEWRLADAEDLTPGARRALLGCLGLRSWDRGRASLFSDLCLCEVRDAAQCEAAYRFAEEHCGARIPLVVVVGPPAGIYARAKDWGLLAAWYFRAVERLHGA